MVRFYVPIKPRHQRPHILQKPLRKRVDIGYSIPVTSIPVLCESEELIRIKYDKFQEKIFSLVYTERFK